MKPAPPAASPEPKLSRTGGIWPAVLLGLAVAAAYANSLSGPFIFDDQTSVTDNQSIRHLATAFRPDHGSGQTVEGRPILNLTLALDYAFGGTRVRGYHLTNVLIHLLAGLTLFGLARRTLRMPSLKGRFGEDATWLAGSIALLWAVHPLQTDSVTYTVQRAESLMGLFFLFTLYAFIRSLDSAHSGFWRFLCAASFLLGVGTKEVIVTALPLLLLYDCVFVSGSLAGAWRAHRSVYLALGSCVVLLAALIFSGGWNRSGTIGLGIGISPLAHALTQPSALLTYLKLSVLPSPLVLDYGTFRTLPGSEVVPEAIGILLLLALTVVALKRSPALGFVGAWFFLILAPTSLAPEATQTMAEHRMYLPLAAVITLTALGLHSLLGRRSFPILFAMAGVLGWLTAQRNETYRTEVGIWRDAVARRPNNERAHYSLGAALAHAGQMPEAVAEYVEALRLKPGYAEAHSNLGNALNAEGRTSEAIAQYEEALRLNPNYAVGHNNLGGVLSAEGRTADAVEQFEEALRLKPDYAEAHGNLGNALNAEGRNAEAIAEFEEALRLKPDYAEAHSNLGIALGAAGRDDEAIAQYGEALRLRPEYPEAHYNLGSELIDKGRTAEAIAQYREALRIKPDYAEAHNNLGIALSVEGRAAEALAHYEEAARLKPDNAAIQFNLAVALLKAPGRAGQAAAHLETVLRLQPGNDRARQILAAIKADPERFGPGFRSQ